MRVEFGVKSRIRQGGKKVVLIYNSELGVIISSEFFLHKETPEEALFSP